MTTPSHAPARQRGRPRSPEIEQRIVHAAAARFATRGFDRVAVDELAQDAGISKATLYRYFRTKQVLFKAAFDHLVARLPAASELTNGTAGDPVEEQLFAIARRAGQMLSSATFELIRRALASDLPPPLREHIRNAGAPYVHAIDGYLREQASRGLLRVEDAPSATSLFIALIAGPEALRSRCDGAAFGEIDDAHLRRAVQVFVKGHSPPPVLQRTTGFTECPSIPAP